MQQLYFDYAASTPVDPAVLRAMRPYFTAHFGNPGSLHSFGQKAVAALDEAREMIGHSVGAEFREIIFTSSATEANNLAIQGVVRDATCDMRHGKHLPKVIVSAIEHESVLETARIMERGGVIELAVIPVDRNGIVDLLRLTAELTRETALVSVMYVNNEIGSIQPLAEISKIIQNFRNEKQEAQSPRQIRNLEINNEIISDLEIRNSNFPLFHTDAAQAYEYFDCNAQVLGVDFMTLSSQKIYGPKGAGVLYASQVSSIKYQENGNKKIKSFLSGTPDTGYLTPIIHGGGQEFGIRSGTENIPAIVGMAKASEIAHKNRSAHRAKVSALRNHFWQKLKKISPKVQINGVAPDIHNPPISAPHILNVFFPGIRAQDLLTRLDLAGFAASAGSACRARGHQTSPVIEALGYPAERARSSVRFSFGIPTTRGEIEALLRELKKVCR